MKRFMIALTAVLLGCGVFAQFAQAARLGGSKSFGMNRSSPMMQRDARPPQQVAPPPAAAAPAAPAPRSGMWGMLGGLALGAGLGALLGNSGFGGMGGGLLTMLLLVGGVILLFRWLASRMPQAQTAPNVPPPMRFEPTAVPSSSVAPSSSAPTGFDTEGFLRQAKLNFVRLQAANDAGNMDDLKAFTTPEVYAEVQLQYQERGKAKQQTDVVQLDATLLELANENGRQLASVRYSGLIRENPDAAPAQFDEVWHLTRPEDGSSGWMVAGIQQFA